MNWLEGTKIITKQIKLKQIDADELQSEKQFVSNEFKTVDIEIARHTRNDPRKIATVQRWFDYANALCDHIKDEQITGDRPTRPQ